MPRSGGSRRRTAATRRSSPTPRSRPSTSPFRTRCISSGRSGRSRPASTCSARSRSRATPRRWRPPSTSPTAPDSCSARRSCGATIRRPPGSWSSSRAARSASSASCARPSATGCTTTATSACAATWKAAHRWTSAVTTSPGSRLLGGEPERVLGVRRGSGRPATDWVFTGTLRFPGDVIATFDCGTALPNRDELEAIGSEGSLFLDYLWHCKVPVIELRGADGVERIELETSDSYRLELENVSDGDPRRGRAAARARGTRWGRPACSRRSINSAATSSSVSL